MPQNDKDNIETVNAKKIIYIEIDEELTKVYDRIKSLKVDEIYIVVPARSVLFQSVVNLKILKRKTEDIGKNISIVTNDRIGIHLAREAGLKVYDRITPLKDKSPQNTNPRLRISPLKASSNPREDDGPRKLPMKKVSIFDIIRKSKGNLKTLPLNRFTFNQPKKMTTFIFGNRRALSFFSILSIILLVIISYFTLPGATLYLTPNSSILEVSVNVTLADSSFNAQELASNPVNVIASYPLQKTITHDVAYHSTGQIFQGTNAIGKLTIINEANYEWPLKARTRFQTEDGLVFRSFAFITVPSNTPQGKGQIEISVQADPYDANEQAIGSRGNIGPSKFFLPGLQEESRKLLYAVNSEPFTGGTSIVTYQVTDDDIKAAQEKAKKEVRDKVNEELKKYVETLSKEKDIPLRLLEGNFAIETSEPSVSLQTDIVGSELEFFDVHSEIDASGIAYNSDDLLKILKLEMEKSKTPGKRLARIDENSLYFRIFDINDAAKKIRITASIKGINEFEIDPESDEGGRFMQKIVEHITGKNIDEARAYIENLPEINKVVIKSWPYFARRLPKVSSNIDVKILREGESIEE